MNKALDKSYAWTPKKELTIEGRRVTRGQRINVLGKKGGKVRVRDDRGNEALVDAEALQAR